MELDNASFTLPNKADFEGLGLFDLEHHYQAYFMAGAKKLMEDKKYNIVTYLQKVGVFEQMMMQKLASGMLQPSDLDRLEQDCEQLGVVEIEKFKNFYEKLVAAEKKGKEVAATAVKP